MKKTGKNFLVAGVLFVLVLAGYLAGMGTNMWFNKDSVPLGPGQMVCELVAVSPDLTEAILSCPDLTPHPIILDLRTPKKENKSSNRRDSKKLRI